MASDNPANGKRGRPLNRSTKMSQIQDLAVNCICLSNIHQIQGQVAHIKFVKNKNNTTAMHGDPCELPALKIKYNLDPEGYWAAGHKAPDMAGATTSASANAICDTGANICLMSEALFKKLNAPKKSLIKATMLICIANQTCMDVTPLN